MVPLLFQGGALALMKKGWRLPRGRSRKTTSPFAPGRVTGGLGFSRQHLVTTPVQKYISRRDRSCPEGGTVSILM